MQVRENVVPGSQIGCGANIVIRIELYRTINEIPVSVWERFVNRKAVGLEIEHLKAIEYSHINDIHPYYIIGYIGIQPIGIAYCFSISVDLARMANMYPPEVIATVKTWKPDFMDMHILEIGHIASLGTTIEVFQPFVVEFIQALTNKIDEIAQLENTELILIRDISTIRYKEFEILERFGYQSLLGFPIARLPLRWKNFDEYLAALKAKKRNSVQKKRTKLQVPEITVEVIEDYAPYSERLAELWTNVAKRQNGYQHERLTPAYFEKMSLNLKGRSHVIAIKQNGKIVAYGLNLVGDEELFGVAEGLDYEVRDRYDLYANNIFEGIRVACEMEKKVFNIGITAYDFKTSIGAELDPCIYFIKAVKKPEYTRIYVEMIQKSIPQPENYHRVFKDSLTFERVQIKDNKIIQSTSKISRDIFNKHMQYIRTDTAHAADIYSFCPVFESAQEPVIKHNGRDIIMLGTNAYLGLATHPKIMNAACEAIYEFGTGCSGSPMLNGTLDLHRKLTYKLADFMHKQDALIFSTGYQTNVGVLSALANRNDIIIMDERNHASLVDGAVLSRAQLVRYKHNSLKSLETALKKYADKPKIVVTDSLFSMEGTLIDLPNIIQLVKQYHARLMLDESHAIGVIGPNGKGVAEHYGLIKDVDLLMGTFSKSFASIGGFVAGDRKILDTLKHTSRAHIFSASLPPSAIAAVIAAMEIIDEEPERRHQLLKNAKYLAGGLQNLGYHIDYHGSAIIPVYCNHELIALAAFQKLLKEGIFVNPVTSPAVPKNQEMLRISLMATHTEPILLQALDIFKKIRTPNWPLRALNIYNN